MARKENASYEKSGNRTAKLTAEDVGALPLTGGTINGRVLIKDDIFDIDKDLAKARIIVGNGDAENGDHYVDFCANGKETSNWVKIRLGAEKNGEYYPIEEMAKLIYYNGDNNVFYNLYGEHNHRRTLVGHDTSTSVVSSKPWFKVASLTMNKAYHDSNIVFFVMSTYGTLITGILVCNIRTNGTGYEKYQFYWLNSNSAVTRANFILAHTDNDAGFPCKAEIWCKIPTNWQGINFEVITESTRIGYAKDWVLTEPGLSTVGGYAEPTSGYTQVVSV